MRTPPEQLKALTPFVQRGNELRTADPAMAYWCSYYAARQGISAKIDDKEANLFLMDLMDDLESQKKALASNDAVVDDSAGSAYIENFALKVFVGADNEDRSGKASRATARKFLAASNFLELLKVFGDPDPEILEKIKYSKWKAADIAKAFREGRQPVPGPAGGLDPEEINSRDPGNPELSLPSTKEDDAYVAREMAKLMGDDASASSPLPPPPTTGGLSPISARPSTPSNEVNGGFPTAVSPSKFEEESNEFPGMSRSVSARAKARLSVDGRQGLSATSPNFSKPIRTGSSSSIPTEADNQENIFNPPPTEDTSAAWIGLVGAGLGEEQRRSVDASSSDMWLNRRDSNFHSTVSPPPGALSPNLNDSNQLPNGLPTSGSAFLGFPSGSSGTVSPGGRPLPTPPPRDGLPLPPGPPSAFLGQRSHSPGPTAPSHPTLPTSPNPSAPPLPPPQSQQTLSHPPKLPSAPAVAPLPNPSSTLPPPPPRPQVDESTFPDSLEPKDQAKAQKLCKWAASALDYDDLDTARKQLREALDILEGRVKAAV